MQLTTFFTTVVRTCLAGLLAVMFVTGVTGCYCTPYGKRGACGPQCGPRCMHGGSPQHREPAPPPQHLEHGGDAAESCPPGREGRKPVHRLAHHLKPHGALQPQVPVAPLPKFHPLPTKPVFEPSYFDTVIGPAEGALPYGPAELTPPPPGQPIN